MSRNGFLVISGCPRSGTSVNMDIQRAVHGDDNICGEKFPQETRNKFREVMKEQQENEPDHEWNIRNYIQAQQDKIDDEKLSNMERDFKDMNPEGFYEMAFTVQGIIYRHQFKKLLSDVKDGDFQIVKVVSQGLLASDPNYIGKIIYTIRHPRAVAKSQERLVRGFDVTDEDGKSHNIFENIVIHTPEMFINVTAVAARFILENPEIPIRFYHFEDLVSKPIEVITDMSEFVGHGDYTKAHDIVQPKLNRSKHEDVASDLWDDAEFVYEHFCNAADIINEYNGVDIDKLKESHKKAEPELKAILEYLSDPKRNINREKRNWRCYRSKHTVTEAQCKLCYARGDVAKNFKKHSEKVTDQQKATHWCEEPCLFECGMDLDRDPDAFLTIEESIDNNFWYDI